VYDPTEQEAICKEIIAHAAAAAEAVQNDPLTVPPDTEMGKKLAKIVAESVKMWEAFIGPMMQIAPALKNPTFEEEREWRVVRGPFSEQDAPPRGLCFRAGKYTVIPYLNFELADQDRPLELDEIIVGPNPDPDQAIRSVKYLLEAENVRCRNVREYSGTLRTW